MATSSGGHHHQDDHHQDDHHQDGHDYPQDDHQQDHHHRDHHHCQPNLDLKFRVSYLLPLAQYLACSGMTNLMTL